MLACSQLLVGLRLLDASIDFVLWYNLRKSFLLNNYFLIYIFLNRLN